LAPRKEEAGADLFGAPRSFTREAALKTNLPAASPPLPAPTVPATRASSRGGARRSLDLCWLTAALVVAALVHAPSLRLGFVSDDFEWLRHARTVLNDPGRLLVPFGGVRPALAVSLAVNMLACGVEPFGYHLANLVLHLGCGALLFLLLGRLSLPAPICAAITALWLCSPYSLEPAQAVQSRQETSLLACWLGLGLVWPGPDLPWTRGRAAGAGALALLSALTKESWVVLPGFCLAFDLWLRDVPLRRAVRNAAVVALAPFAFTIIYFINPAIAPGSYLTGGFAALGRVPHALAVFLNLRALVPALPTVGPAEVGATVVLAALLVFGWLKRNWCVGVGLAFFVLPFLPILTVPFLTSRYTTIPLLGLLMVLGGTATELIRLVRPPVRLALVAALGVLFATQLTLDLLTLRGDMADASRLDAAHRRLLAETRAFLTELPKDRVLVVVRLDRADPLRDLVESVAGIPKAYFDRVRDPYGLIDWPSLLTFALDPNGGPVFEAVEPEAAGTASFSVLAHLDGGFRLITPLATSVPGEVRAWEARGFHPRVVRPMRQNPGR
jgi:hypothetical protein